MTDSSHVPVSHHGIIGSRDDAKPFSWTRIANEGELQDAPFDFKYALDPPGSIEAENAEASHHFQPPCLMRIETVKKTGGRSLLALYATPTKPGYTRLIGTTVTVPNPDGSMPSGFGPQKLVALMPTWLSHQFGSKFIMQDMLFLHHQEQTMADQMRVRGKDWHESCFIPTPVDRMSIGFRRWLDQHGTHSARGSHVPYAPEAGDLPPRLSENELFDVWETHSKNCTACAGASRGLAIARAAFAILAAACAVAGASAWMTAKAAAVVLLESWPISAAASAAASAIVSLPLSTLAWWLAAALCGAAAAVCGTLRARLHHFPFSHQDND